MSWFLEIFGFSIFAGLIGSLVGIGGGILIVPFLTLVMGVKSPRGRRGEHRQRDRDV